MHHELKIELAQSETKNEKLLKSPAESFMNAVLILIALLPSVLFLRMP